MWLSFTLRVAGFPHLLRTCAALRHDTLLAYAESAARWTRRPVLRGPERGLRTVSLLPQVGDRLLPTALDARVAPPAWTGQALRDARVESAVPYAKPPALRGPDRGTSRALRL